MKKAEGLKIQDKPIKEYNQYGVWHPPIQIIVKNSMLTVSGCITGCGLGQMYGVASYCNKADFKADPIAFKALLKPAKQSGIGAVIATLGHAYFQHHQKMLDLGFVLVNQYANYRHGDDGRYKQRLYMITL